MGGVENVPRECVAREAAERSGGAETHGVRAQTVAAESVGRAAHQPQVNAGVVVDSAGVMIKKSVGVAVIVGSARSAGVLVVVGKAGVAGVPASTQAHVGQEARRIGTVGIGMVGTVGGSAAVREAEHRLAELGVGAGVVELVGS